MAKKRKRTAKDRVEVGILFLALVAVAAFVGSFVAGLDWSVPGGPPETASPPQATRGLPAPRPALRDPAVPRTEPVRVEVLNGAGKGGIAREATERLREAGFDVVYFGNADRFDHATSVVLDRAGDLAAARDVADALGIHEVRSDPDANLYLDATVVLGGDWVAPPVRVPPADSASLLERARRALRELGPG